MSPGEQLIAVLVDLVGTFFAALIDAAFGAFVIPFFEAIFDLLFGGVVA